MSKKGKKQQEAPASNSAGWLCTFNDLMTNLMVFFVLVFSMGSLDLDKSSGLIDSLQSGLGVLEGGNRVDVTVLDNKLSTAEMENDMGNLREVYSELLQDLAENGEDALQKGNLSEDKVDDEMSVVRNYYTPNKNPRNIKSLDGIETSIKPQGIYITLKDNLLFESGYATLNFDAYPVLKLVADTIKKIPYDIRIEGHTDNQPIHTPIYPSNWELSTDRAIHVLKFLIKEGNILPEKLSAVGYADAKPIAENDTPANRSKNRRVEIVLLNKRIR